MNTELIQQVSQVLLLCERTLQNIRNYEDLEYGSLSQIGKCLKEIRGIGRKVEEQSYAKVRNY